MLLPMGGRFVIRILGGGGGRLFSMGQGVREWFWFRFWDEVEVNDLKESGLNININSTFKRQDQVKKRGQA